MSPTTLFLRDFTVLDFAFFDSELGLRGESFYVSAELSGELDHQGFIFDFGPAKKLLKQLVDESFDHKLAVPTSLPGLARAEGGWRLRSGAGDFTYSAPKAAWVELPGEAVTREGIAAALAELARAQLPANVTSVRFELRDDPRFERDANFRYTHGLRFHDGNCQRLFHGHRNPIEVWQNGARLAAWEARLASEWTDAHFVAAATLENRAKLDFPVGRRAFAHSGEAAIRYKSPQGEFFATFPARKMVLLENEPSIENIARIGAEWLRQEGLAGEFSVVAYEGLNKGARFTSC